MSLKIKKKFLVVSVNYSDLHLNRKKSEEFIKKKMLCRNTNNYCANEKIKQSFQQL
jgi:hypothetical protein